MPNNVNFFIWLGKSHSSRPIVGRSHHAAHSRRAALSRRVVGFPHYVELIDPTFRDVGGVDEIVDFWRSKSINRFPLSIITSIQRAPERPRQRGWMSVVEFFAGHRLNRPDTRTNRGKSNNGRFVGQKNCPLIVFGRSGAPSAVHAGACTGNAGAWARGRVGVRVRGHAGARPPASAPTRSLTCSALSVQGSNCGVRGRGALLHHGCCQAA